MYKAGLTIIAALAASQALADTRMVMSDSSDQSTSAISVSNGKVAFEENGRAAMLFYSKTSAFTMLNHDQQGYVVMDKAAMDEVSGQMDAMMKEAMAELESLPPEQREMAMRMMPGMMDRLKPKAKPAAADVKFTGETDKVAGYSCKVARVSGTAGGDSTVCVAKAGALDIPSADLEAMDAAFASLQQAVAQFGQDAPFPSISELGGVPVRAIDEDGSVMTLTSISNDKLDGALFAIPAGYKRQSIME